MTLLYVDTSALFKRYVEEDDVIFACFDNNLRQAATAEGLDAWPE